MTIDDVPMDELDLAIRREAATLRNQLATSAHTDEAWDDFLVGHASRVVEPHHWQGRRRRLAIAVGLVAALVVAALIVRTIVDRNSTQLPVISPAPSTVVATDARYAAVTLGTHQRLFAVRNDGTRTVIGTIPPEVVGAVRSAYGPNYVGDLFAQVSVSATGWVAVTASESTGFWFFDLQHPETPARFVTIPGQTIANDSRIAWNPTGTLLAVAVLDTPTVIVDPTTSKVTAPSDGRLLVGDPPIWTTDGTGTITSPSQTAFGEISVEQRGERQAWASSTDVQPAELLDSTVSSNGDSLWVLAAVGTGSKRIELDHVPSPHVVRTVNTLGRPNTEVREVDSAFMVAVAPDDASAVVGLHYSSGTVYDAPSYHLVPTDGSEPTDLRGPFAGFVPVTLVDELGT